MDPRISLCKPSKDISLSDMNKLINWYVKDGAWFKKHPEIKIRLRQCHAEESRILFGTYDPVYVLLWRTSSGELEYVHINILSELLEPSVMLAILDNLANITKIGSNYVNAFLQALKESIAAGIEFDLYGVFHGIMYSFTKSLSESGFGYDESRSRDDFSLTAEDGLLSLSAASSLSLESIGKPLRI